MAPTLRDGDQLVVRWGGRPAIGRLVVVRWAGRPLSVKRVVLHDQEGWWVQRDNPVEGVDSWQAGPLPDVDVLAIVVARVWPMHRLRRFSRVGSGDRSAGHSGSPPP